VRTPLSHVVSYFDTMTASSARNLWAFGYDLAGKGLILHGNGTTWSLVPASAAKPGVSYLGSAVAPDGTAWAVGYTGPFQTLAVRWNGRSWTRQRTPGLKAGVSLNAVAATSKTSAWAVGVGGRSCGRTLILRWTSHGWKRVPSPM
jgi:photosystem II stability/assembly factor-like uncharacterized protein